MIKDNLVKVEQKIASVCERIGRNPQDIILIGVTKYSELPAIEEAIHAKLTHIAENRVQEAQRKYIHINNPGVTKHLIGHLQSNKAKYAVELFDLIHSVDSLKLAAELDKSAAKLNKKQNILIQVNTSHEDQKSGVDPKEAISLMAQIGQLKNIYVVGLMTMAALTEDKDVIRQSFRQLKGIFDQAKAQFNGQSNIEMKYLSMGMSDDYEIALEEGSNMIRIGRAIFTV